MHSNYKFEWLPKDSDTKTLPFRLTSRVGMEWEGYFNLTDESLNWHESLPILKMGYQLTKGGKAPIPAKGLSLLNYYASRMVTKAIRFAIKNFTSK